MGLKEKGISTIHIDSLAINKMEIPSSIELQDSINFKKL